MKVYYNEIEPFACDWLENLMLAGLIPDGDIDRRSIVDVMASDLRGYRQCHFFAGIAGWSYALQLAAWPTEREVWTGSCPCQPFSAAGRRQGTADKRHLWPEFHRLIAKCKPAVVFGEQVASKPGREWFAGVRADLEDVGYRIGSADLCAAGVGAPHIRQRLWFVADSNTASEGMESRRDSLVGSRQQGDSWAGPWGSGAVGDMGYAAREQQHGCRDAGPRRRDEPTDTSLVGVALGDTKGEQIRLARQSWEHFDVVDCRDGKARRIEPGTFPLAHGIPGRVGKLRAYGNAIVPQVAAEFIAAYRQCVD